MRRWSFRQAISTGEVPFQRGILAAVLVCSFVPAISTTIGQEGGSDDESKRRLIRKTKGEGDGDLMSRIIDHMDQAGGRLADTFDPGDATQQIQKQALRDLDLAIKQAKQNMRASRSASSQNREKRSEGQTSDDTEGDDAKGQSDSGSGDEGAAGLGGGIEIGKDGGTLSERRRHWGHLPARDRDAMIQSTDDEFHEKYRRQIERYYETLADPELDQ